MTDQPQQDLLDQDGMRARKFRTGRTMFALMMREMSTSYGRSPGGYAWAILEPVLALAVLSTIFSFVMRSPAIGDSFPLFYATGYLPFMLFNDVANKTSTALNHSRPLLRYPAVTFIDALMARALLHLLTHTLVAYIVFFGIAIVLDLQISPDYTQIAISYLMGGLLGFGVGCFNCYVMMSFPVWERMWQILTRPLIFISGLFFPYETMPQFAQDILWWNPLIHVVGFLRKGIYAPGYTGDYLSLIFPILTALILLGLGLLLLWRNHQSLLEG
ncbi:capsular polysaccharide transport system permease protein [Pacificibacter maritimus]|uniref:Transport permease protein n=1 Tax=Pacificibacter maritimus TaxID=762213 RepID=A0A3N4UBY8_9RHOB|nr:ABC transporter permease [Pacificibacter maritimus]RPE62827.1 capsular polysaccharide transport system permease protein [Pacificibacter maritimus]